MNKRKAHQTVEGIYIIIQCIFPSFSSAESPARDLQITAYK